MALVALGVMRVKGCLRTMILDEDYSYSGSELLLFCNSNYNSIVYTVDIIPIIDRL